MTAYTECLRIIDEGRFACCISGTQDGEPAVMVPELHVSRRGLIAAFHPDVGVRAGFAIGTTIGLHRYLTATEDEFQPAASETATP